MKIVYPVRFTFLKDEKDTVLIEVPDLDILSEGYGLSNAIDMARDAIELTMVTLEDNNMPVPVASDEKELCKMDGMFTSEGYTMLSLVDADSTNYRRKVRESTRKKSRTRTGGSIELKIWEGGDVRKKKMKQKKIRKV